MAGKVKTGDAVAYIRVSTLRQARSGLGLDAQADTIATFAKAEGYKLVARFTEHESGKGADALDRRPQLAAAIKAAKKAGGPIIVSKLDRLSRDVLHQRADDAELDASFIRRRKPFLGALNGLL